MAIICRDHRLLFIMPPRTGCTAIGELLLNELGGEWLPNDSMQRGKGQPQLEKKHNCIAELIGMGFLKEEELGSLLKFTTVRNPFDSLVSQYVKKKTLCEEYLADPDNYVHRMPKYLEDMKFCASHSFEEWIQRRFRINPIRRWLGLGRKSLYKKFTDRADVIMRFETLNDDFQQVLRQAGVRDDLAIPTINVTQGRRNNYREYYSQQSQRLIAYTFEEDLRAYGYAF